MDYNNLRSQRMERQVDKLVKRAMESLSKISELSESGDLDMFHNSDCAKLSRHVKALVYKIKQLNSGKRVQP